MGSFKGFPEFGRRVQERLTREPVLAGYQTIEQCSLEYRANEGSCISPHIDDCLAPSAQEPLLWHQLSRPPTVRLPMPARSLLVMQAEARYEWLHGILRSDISGRRVCLALREFTPAFMPGGEEEQLGAEVTAQAQCFFTPQTAGGEVSA
ncbi:Alpha-ketoglutarate-dependent dioxygenase alkB 4 [Amphibalanus amphitrite]|uniref:Alpha-ketoglutarate-dependent dioxygenase alkB 4 n=1 Tax=Amphibalanus amphitrite TaxID=1232801 RepID=A0A6A4VY85_AMPAM|nr:Alpha-ketoglutarate-dependent dioxygenase alkB 4 [Amphibalanus amphitrite]